MHRRTLLRSTALGAFGLSMPDYLQMQARASAGSSGRVRSLIFLFLYGGPSQIDTWDMKPDASEDYRGEFRPIRTAVPGTLICEHLPRMARLARHYSLIRTLHHANSNHQPAGCFMLTGVNPRSDNAAFLRPRPDDPPALGSLMVRLAPPARNTVPPFVMMPAKLFDQGAHFRGQAGGWLGSGADPLMILQDPNLPGFHVDGFDEQQDVSAERRRQRRQLLEMLDHHPGNLRDEPGARALNQFQQQAFDLITSRRCQSAFDLDKEPGPVRDRYGRTRFGQGCLLARRLIEAGARVVTVSDCTMSGGHEWDTHSNNFSMLRGTLLPRVDQAYSALLEDLMARGLLEDTVVYLGGEFGRTPRLGQAGFSGAGATRSGRDHYPHCFPGILAGGRIRPGMVHGQSDSKAAFPTRDPVTPGDLMATLFAAMGLDPAGHVYTRDNRPMPVTYGQPVQASLA